MVMDPLLSGGSMHNDGSDDDGGDEVYELDERGSREMGRAHHGRPRNGSFSYTAEEERAVVEKFDRRLVLFVAFLYMLSFLDRSSPSYLPFLSHLPDYFTFPTPFLAEWCGLFLNPVPGSCVCRPPNNNAPPHRPIFPWGRKV